LLIIVLAIFTTVFVFSPRQYYPSSVKDTALRFSQHLLKYEIKKASNLLHPLSPAGRDLNVFMAMINSQLYKPGSSLPPLSHYRYKSLYPFQSYGNKVRRLISGSQKTIPIYYVEMRFFRGRDERIPMPVRITLKTHKGRWLIVKAYLHAE